MNELITLGPVVLSAISVTLLLLVVAKLGTDRGPDLEGLVRAEFKTNREESSQRAREAREELARNVSSSSESVVKTIGEMQSVQQQGNHQVELRVKGLIDSNEQRLEKLRAALEQGIKGLQNSNEAKLEQMRQTVDEKLQSTLEKRLGESFKQVSERLESVHRGLGEMQELATGVGDLKRVLTNVKARGSWGEVQVASILEQVLTADQWGKNVQPKPDSSEVVEFAIRLPGTDGMDKPVWLPIDAKFPREAYERLMDASEKVDKDGVDAALKELRAGILKSAKDIADKYVSPPHTTDFAVMFLPTEGLYAEVLRIPGLVDDLQTKHRVVVAGPTTFAALLNSLRMGFRTLAIEQRSSEVWQVLGAVKTEFGKFGDVLAKVDRQLRAAANTIEQSSVRTRAMERTLRNVEQLPESESVSLLGLDDFEFEEESALNESVEEMV